MGQKIIGSVHIATLHDCLQRAQRVAPTKGAAYDKAAGFHLTFKDDQMTIRATNLEATYIQHVDAMVSEEAIIRLPSMTLAQFVGSLPMGGEQHVFFIRTDSDQIIVRFGKTKTKAKLNQITGDFPKVEWYPISTMTPAQELASHIESVAWATEDHGILSGVRIDGEHLTALSHRMAAQVGCPVDVAADPVIALLGPIVPLIKLGTDIRMGVREERIVLALDESTQVTSTVLLGEWPNLLERLESMPMPSSFKVAKRRWMDGLQRLLLFVRNDRLPQMILHLEDGTMDMQLNAPGSGDVQDVAQIIDHEGEVCTFYFNPQLLLDALTAYPGDVVTVKYSDNRKPMQVVAEDREYSSWVIGIDPGVAVAGRAAE